MRIHRPNDALGDLGRRRDDLLAALEAMLGSARNDSEHTGPSARALALSAIAKARGTKP